MSNSKKIFIGLIFLLPFLALVYFVSIRQSLLWLIGLGYGMLLGGTAFGFTTGWRKLIEKKDASGMKAQFLLIIILFILSVPILVFFPQINPAQASISYSLLIGAFFFGMFMQLADGCGSGTLYKAGSLKTMNLLTFLGFIIGAFWGSIDMPTWLELGTIYPSFNFIRGENSQSVGQFNSINPSGILIHFFLLVAVFYFFKMKFKSSTKNSLQTYGAIGLALLAYFNLLIAGQPWGIVYGLGLWGAKFYQLLGGEVSGLYWQSGYNAQALTSSILLDSTSITNIGLIVGASLITLRKEKNTKNIPPSKISLHAIIVPIIVGIILGYSSRLAFGCNIGAFVSGLSTGSLHGWVWFIFAFGGTIIGVRLRKLNFFSRLY